MKKYQDYFKDKKITVMGLGLLGRGVGDAAYIAEAGAKEVLVTDLKTEAELTESVEKLKGYSNVTFVLGEHREEDFQNRDLVLVSADVHYQSPYLAHARQSSVPLKQSAALFAELSQIPIIGVTGTRGKSMVTHMVHHILSYTTGEDIILGGNIKGVSNLQLLKQVHKDALAVMELDSWQLQGFAWAEISPQIAVFTNFMEDHLNYYQKDGVSKEEAMQRYFADKANIFRYQEESGVLVTTPEVFKLAQHYAKDSDITLGQEVVLADTSILPEDLLLATPGEHNRQSAALAYEVAKAVGLTEEEIESALATFPGVSGRLQYVGTLEGKMVAVYNDNNATTPQATTVALETLGQEAKVVLLAGGSDKNIPLEELVKAIKKYCKEVLLLPGTGTDRLKKELEASDISYVAATDLAEAIEKAIASTEDGEILLFSPAFASFGQFKNEYDRNDAFMRELGQYQA